LKQGIGEMLDCMIDTGYIEDLKEKGNEYPVHHIEWGTGMG